MKNICLSIIISGLFTMAVVAPESVDASQQLNVRQNIGNSSMNKIASARLQGMFAGKTEKTVKSTKEFGRRGCTTSIGNQQAGSSLIGQPRDVIISGDVTNVCL